MRLKEALQLAPDDVVAFVGGGGKTTAMFRLAREIVDDGGRVVTTTTTRIFAAQTRLAPVHVYGVPELLAALEQFPHVLLTGPVDTAQGKAFGVEPGVIAALRARLGRGPAPAANILIEADGSRMRPFKAPAEHEPVIPDGVSVVVPVVGVDALGKPLSDEFVHRAERVRQLHPGATVTARMVADVLASPLGGRKGVPAGARVVALINKVDSPEREAEAGALAALLGAGEAFDGVMVGAVGAPGAPVLRVWRRA